MKCRKWVELIRKTTELNAGNNSVQFGASATADDDFAQDMELDDQPNGGNQSNGLGKAVASETVLLHDQYLMEAMAYGQELSREYGGQGDYAKTLNETFSLLAYHDPSASVNGHLLESSGRSAVAEELNSAILGKSLTHVAHHVDKSLMCCSVPGPTTCRLH